MSRVYTIKDQQYYSVTTMLGILDKPALVPWAANTAADKFAELLIGLPTFGDGGYRDLTGDRIREFADIARKAHRAKSKKALDVGTITHDLIEQYCKTGDAPDLKDDTIEVQAAWAAWMAWVDEHDYEPLHAEVEIVNHKHRYAGRFDAIARVDGKVTLLDFKTSSGIYDEMLYQLSAYWQGDATDGTTLPDIEQAGILRLDKATGIPEWKAFTMDDLFYGWEVFKPLCQVYYLIKGAPKERSKK